MVLLGLRGVCASGTATVFCAVFALTGLTFAMNDLLDAEADSQNKPWKPLVVGRIGPSTVRRIALGFSGLGILSVAIEIIRDRTGVILLSYGVIGVSYNLLKARLGRIKNAVAAIAMTLLFLYIAVAGGALSANGWLILAAFSYLCYREILMDVWDVVGDKAVGLKTIAGRLSQGQQQGVIGALWYLTVVLLVAQSEGLGDSWLVVCIAVVSGFQNLVWVNVELSTSRRRLLVYSMWIPMLLSVFLFRPG
jgi:4-hydroxybenzoate polyprenyltransferase